MVEESLQTEYLLKSAVNIARVIIGEDTSPEDGPQDTWGYFLNGQPIPLNILDIHEPGLRLALEIRPEEGKFPLRALLAGGSVQSKWRDALARLFESLGFDDDGEKDQTGLFPDKSFQSQELVSNLIDFMDRDQESYVGDDFPRGIEDELPRDYFPNAGLRRVGELSLIPGFTPARMRLLTPLVTAFGSSRRVNINLTPSLVLRCLHPDMDDSRVQAIIDFREGPEGPFDGTNLKTNLSQIIGEDEYNEMAPMIGVRANWFQVISKVESGSSLAFMRAYISKSAPGELPVVRMAELY